jgi:hypothetical protein
VSRQRLRAAGGAGAWRHAHGLIVDVDGKLVWIDGETFKGAGPEPGQEVQRIIDSIQFE